MYIQNTKIISFFNVILILNQGIISLYQSNTTITDLEQITIKINSMLAKYQEDDHLSRCKWQSTRESRSTFATNVFQLNHPVMVFILPDSLGNTLGQYFENRICANRSGIHYITVQRRWLPPPNQAEDIFLSALPSAILHPNPNPDLSVSKIDKLCPCNDMCHEYENGLLHKHLDEVRSMYLSALHTYWGEVTEKKFLIPTRNTKASIVGNYSASLPVVPDVAVHYRCGDNLVGHYGFLPFYAFRALIPPTSRHIYILCESAERYNHNRPDQRSRCELVLQHLHQYLTKAFPAATVLLLRGQDIVLDLYRLTYAATTVCSVSTFCLWPALASTTTAYFPVSRLVAKASMPDYGPHFVWLKEPPIVKGVRALGMTHEQLLHRLSTQPATKQSNS